MHENSSHDVGACGLASSSSSSSSSSNPSNTGNEEVIYERDLRARNPQFAVILKTDDLLIIDKPPDVRIDGDFPITVEKYVQTEHPDLLSQTHPKGEKGKLRFIHQLDHATSGILCLGFTRAVTALLGKCFEKRTVKKAYLALVYGWPALGQPVELNWPIADVSPDSFLMCVGTPEKPGRAAQTTVTPLKHGFFRGQKVSKVLLQPHSGRRHQLRVHCVEWGHPIVGDYTYTKDDPQIIRMMLHAWKLFLPVAIGEHGTSEGTWFETADPFDQLLAPNISPSPSTSISVDNRKTASNSKYGYQWKLLKNFCCQKRTGLNGGGGNGQAVRAGDEDGSRRQIRSCRFLTAERVGGDTEFETIRYSIPIGPNEVKPLELRQRAERTLTMADHLAARQDGIDTTGNYFWPSEEALALYLMKNKTSRDSHQENKKDGPEEEAVCFCDKTILEIGCGLGLAGFMLCMQLDPPARMVFTDGNASVVANVAHNIQQNTNRFSIPASQVECHQVLWHMPQTYAQLPPFDFVIGSDCLFFREYHSDLLKMLSHLASVNRNVRILLVQPERGHTLKDFTDLVRSRGGFDVKLRSLKTEDFLADGVNLSGHSQGDVSTNALQLLTLIPA